MFVFMNRSMMQGANQIGNAWKKPYEKRASERRSMSANESLYAIAITDESSRNISFEFIRLTVIIFFAFVDFQLGASPDGNSL